MGHEKMARRPNRSFPATPHGGHRAYNGRRGVRAPAPRLLLLRRRILPCNVAEPMLAMAPRGCSRPFVLRLERPKTHPFRGIVRWVDESHRGWEDHGVRRSGCLNLLFVLLTASLATTLIVVGVFFLLSFAALSFESPAGVDAVLKLLAALIAVYFFVRIGMSVWRDLKERRPATSSARPDNPGSAEDVER